MRWGQGFALAAGLADDAPALEAYLAVKDRDAPQGMVRVQTLIQRDAILGFDPDDGQPIHGDMCILGYDCE